MKLKYLLPFYALLLTVTFCSRKASEDKGTEPAAAADTEEQALTATTTDDSRITGILELDQNTNTIYADITVMVANADFKYANDYMALQTTPTGGFKGLALRYYNTVNNAPDNGPGTTPMSVQFSFPNTKNWAVNTPIRVMSLNEETHSIFTGLTPYFLLRMQTFQNTAITYPQLQSFNASWNAANPSNPIVTGTLAQSKAKEEDTKVKGFIPRLTKDDSILTLKLKK